MHIAKIKNARERCVHVNDWLAIFNHACNEISPFRINANLVKEGSFCISAKFVMEVLRNL